MTGGASNFKVVSSSKLYLNVISKQVNIYVTSVFGSDNKNSETLISLYLVDFSTISLPGSTLKPNVELDLEYSADNYKIHEERRICSVPLEYYKISEFANYIDSVATLIIPFFLITFINVRIAACVWKLKDQRQHIVAGATTSIVHTSKEEESESSSPLQERRSSCQYSETRVSCYQGRASTKLLRSHSERYKLCQQHRYSAVPEQENHDTNESDSEKLRSSRGFHQRKRTVVRFLDDACSEDRERATNFKWRPGTRNTTGLEDVRMMRLVGSNYAKMIALSYILVKHAGTPHQTVHSGEHANPLGSKLRQQRNPGCSSEVRVTKTLLLVSTVFLVLNLPSHAIRCMQFIQVSTKSFLICYLFIANYLVCFFIRHEMSIRIRIHSQKVKHTVLQACIFIKNSTGTLI